MTSEQADWLDVITSFNLNARYDDYKREFYRKCTREFTEEWIEKIKKRIEPHPFRIKDFHKSNPIVYEIVTYGQEIWNEAMVFH